MTGVRVILVVCGILIAGVSSCTWMALRAFPDAKYRDYATVAIGLYAAAAGISEREILIIQNMYAWTNGRFGDEARDKTYTHLLQRNVENTHLGYTMFRTFVSDHQQLGR